MVTGRRPAAVEQKIPYWQSQLNMLFPFSNQPESRYISCCGSMCSVIVLSTPFALQGPTYNLQDTLSAP